MGLNGIGNTRQGYPVSSSETKAAKNSAPEKKPTAASTKGDTVVFDPEQDWNRAVDGCLDYLKSLYPDVAISVSDQDAMDGLIRFAVGNHLTLTLSREFLERMASSPEELKNCKQALADTLKDLEELFDPDKMQSAGAAVDGSGQFAYWIQMLKDQESANKDFWEKMFSVKHYKEKGGRNVTEINTPNGVIRWVFVKRLNYSPASHLSRLARLSRQGPVRSLIGGVQAEINRVKRDSNLDEDEAKQAVARMQGVILKAKTKIRNLDEENNLEVMRKRAAEQEQRKKEMALEIELSRRRTKRKVREYGQIRTSTLPPVLRDDQPREELWEERLDFSGLENVVAADFSVQAAAEAMAAAAPTEASATAVSIDITV